VLLRVQFSRGAHLTFPVTNFGKGVYNAFVVGSDQKDERDASEKVDKKHNLMRRILVPHC